MPYLPYPVVEIFLLKLKNPNIIGYLASYSIYPYDVVSSIKLSVNSIPIFFAALISFCAESAVNVENMVVLATVSIFF